MAKVFKYMTLIVITMMLTTLIVRGQDISPFYDPETDIENFSYINQQLLESSRYTQKDEIDPAVLATYQSDFTLSYTEAQLDTLGFDEIFDNSALTVYFEKDSFSMIVYNKATGYYWSSRAEYQGISGAREDNTANRNLMNSGLWVEYVTSANVSSSSITTASLYTLADASYQTNGAMTEENNDPIHPYLLEAGSYSTRRVETTIKSQTSSQIVVGVDLKQIDISFDVHLSIDGASIGIHIPNESILEYGEIYKLLAIQVFPYFGATREDKFPGYVMIPDGVGALVRTNQRHNVTFQARFFDDDYGYGFNTLPVLSVPIFGMVHAHGQNAYYANITEGAETSQLRAQFWGSGTRYHRITSRFGVRTIYRNIINKAGDGSDAIRDEITASNFSISYNFLSDQDASYVGMAKDYRDHLIENDVLVANEKNKDGDIPLHLSYIMSDQEPSFFGTSKLVMTTPEDVLRSYQSFVQEGITNQQINLYGWSNDGFVMRAPYRIRVSGSRDFEDMTSAITADDNSVYLNNNYIVSSELSRRVSYNRDVARNISRLKMTLTRRMLNGRFIDMYFLIPEQSLSIARRDVDDIKDLGVSGLYMDDLGSVLFSHYDDGIHERTEAIGIYQEIASLYDQTLLSMPNAYMFGYTDGYMNMPITNTQYDFYTDLVPILPIILKGSLSYYTPYLNFNALGEDRLLTMIDFAVNPSYVLTEKPTYEMRFTMANRFFTTERAKYEDEIIETYHYLNDALGAVSDAYITNREVIDYGFVKVSYSNGVTIYVNYTYQTVMDGGHEIAPRHYKVVI